MRPQIILHRASLLLLLAAPLLARAQFQAPTQQELQMTSDPMAPGASAIYLYTEEKSDDSLGVHSYYARIKVLTEKGKDLATIRIPYERGEFKVAHIEGRTIHPDGTVIPMKVKPEDLVNVKTRHFQEDTIVFTLPSVEVGSILEYRYQLRYNDGWVFSPTWHIQKPYFVRKAHYEFHPNSDYGVYITNSRGQRLDELMYTVTPTHTALHIQYEHGRYTLDVTDVPPTPDEDWMPPLNTINERVEFYYTYARSPAEFWNDEGKVWSGYITQFITPDDTLKQAAAAMVAPGDSDEQKARKIYAAVMKLDNTDFSRQKSDAERKKERLRAVNTASDVWKNQGGAGNSIALLYVALARAAGLKAWPMRIVPRNVSVFDKSYLDISQMTDYIAIVTINGKDIYLDPGQKVCAFGELYWGHTLAGGLRLSDSGATLALTPSSPFLANEVQRIGNLTVDAQGNVSGVARIVMTGADALYWRQTALQNDLGEVKKEFEESIRGDFPAGVQVNLTHILGLDDYEANLMAIVTISGKVGSTTGKYLFLPGLLFEFHATHPFVAQEKRSTPIDLHYAKMEKDDLTYTLPPGYSVESTPMPSDISWPGYALLRIKSATTGNSINVVRIYAHAFAILGPEGYNSLHDFYQKLAAADQQQIVLTRATAVKGH